MNIKKYLNKKIVIPAIGVAIAAVGAVSFPHLKEAYKKSKADTEITETSKEIENLKHKYSVADNSLKSNMFLMTGPDEVAPLLSEVTDSSQKLHDLEQRLLSAKVDFRNEKYDKVREQLNDTFNLEDGKERVTPKSIALAEQKDLETKVIGYCDVKHGLRDSVVNNEWFLKARLKKPYMNGMIERTEDFAEIPDSLFKMVPALDDDTKMRLETLPKELYNSMGVSLIKHKWTEEHIILTGLTEDIKISAEKLYGGAYSSYKDVMAKNDALLRYRASEHDGKMSVKEYEALKAAQSEVLVLVRRGDDSLSVLDDFLKELHEQYYIYVSDHTKDSKTFHHTRMVPYTDSEGNFKMKTEHYTTEGYEFFYVLSTVNPQGKKDETLSVGEIDGWSDWNYAPNEAVGFVRKWKRLHDSNDNILSGDINGLKPNIESFQGMCKYGSKIKLEKE